MEQVTCAHCGGSGREWHSVSLDTGAITDRNCAVCGGTGTVAADLEYYTQYPDQSLDLARDLFKKHGKPVQIHIERNHRILAEFSDGARFVLGGFTVGYRGTGPDYTKWLLNSAGFCIEMDQIAAMKPPITLVAGQPYTPTETIVCEAATVEEAKHEALCKLPSHLRAVLTVVREANETGVREGRGQSEAAALEDGIRRLPKGATRLAEAVAEEGAPRTLDLSASSADAARRFAEQQIPAGSVVTDIQVVPPEDRVIGEGRLDGEFVKASSAESAAQEAQSRIPHGAVVMSVQCLEPCRAGFLGFGRKPGQYYVSWSPPRFRITYCSPWIVSLTCRLPAAVKIEFQRAAEREPEPSKNR